MRIHKITYPDIENGLGFRITIWVSGCKHHCKGCQNPQTWDKNSGREFIEADKEKIFEMLKQPYIKGVTFSGGDPLSYYFDEVCDLCKEIKENFPKKDIWLYTGYSKQEIIQSDLKKIFNYIDVLVDGKFEIENLDRKLEFRGSKNQKIYKVIKNEDDNFSFEIMYRI